MNEGFERAAAISVFQLNIRRGIMSLKDGAAVALQNGNKAKSKSAWWLPGYKKPFTKSLLCNNDPRNSNVLLQQLVSPVQKPRDPLIFLPPQAPS